MFYEWLKWQLPRSQLPARLDHSEAALRFLKMSIKALIGNELFETNVYIFSVVCLILFSLLFKMILTIGVM